MTTLDENPSDCHLGGLVRLPPGFGTLGVILGLSSSEIATWICNLGISSRVVTLGCPLGLSPGVVICGCHLGYHLRCHPMMSSGVVIWNVNWGCYLGCVSCVVIWRLSSIWFVIWRCHLGCHLGMSSGVVNWCYHLGFYLVFSSEMVQSSFC
jgi:hypothetical protein